MAIQTQPPKPVALQVTLSPPTDKYGSWEVKGLFVYEDEDSGKWHECYCYAGDHRPELEGLTVYTNGWKNHPSPMEDAQWGFGNYMLLKTERLTSMLAVSTKITKALARFDEGSEEYCASFGLYLGTVAKAVGATAIVLRELDDDRNYSYTGPFSLRQGGMLVDAKIGEYIAYQYVEKEESVS